MKVAIASGKGGTGKTTLSVNLASYLSDKRPVVLTDVDVEEPNSGLFLKGGRLVHREDIFRSVPSWEKDSCTLCGLCREVCNFNAVIKLGDEIMIFPQLCHSCYACSELCPAASLPMIQERIGGLTRYTVGNLGFIESRLAIGQEQAVPLIEETLKYVDNEFPEDILKLYDAPPGTSCPVIEVAKNMDFIILITEPTPFGLHDLTLAVETVRELGKPFAVVINRYGLGNADVEEYCRRENIGILARLPNQRRIAELYSSGKLLYPEVPEIADQLESIAAYIQGLKRTMG